MSVWVVIVTRYARIVRVDSVWRNELQAKERAARHVFGARGFACRVVEASGPLGDD